MMKTCFNFFTCLGLVGNVNSKTFLPRFFFCRDWLTEFAIDWRSGLFFPATDWPKTGIFLPRLIDEIRYFLLRLTDEIGDFFCPDWLIKIIIFCRDWRFCIFLQRRKRLTIFAIFINNRLPDFGIFFRDWLMKLVILLPWLAVFCSEWKFRDFHQWPIDEFHAYLQRLTDKL